MKEIVDITYLSKENRYDMFFSRFEPAKELTAFIECYWIIEDDDKTPRRQKIIPDGFNEIIFHYRDPYRINLSGKWEIQSRSLLAGQIKKHFFLENTGASGIIGIKLKPTALTHLYGLSMQQFTDRVADISSVLGNHFTSTEEKLRVANSHDERIAILNDHFCQLLRTISFRETAADRTVDLIFSQNGMIPVSAIARVAGVGERQLENLFKKHVGLSPKLFTRIIRFSYIFQLIQENNQSWTGLAYEASFFDQSHFIRNFKDFTGENPSDYSFDEKNMANFFLHKKSISPG